MFLVLIPVLHVNLRQIFIPDDQQILCVLLLSSLGKIKAPCDNCFFIDDHDLVMRNGMFTVNVGWNASIRYKSGGGISFSPLAFIQNGFHPYSSFEGFSEGLGNWCRSEGIGLNKDFRFCSFYLIDDGFCATTIWAETDLGLSVV